MTDYYILEDGEIRPASLEEWGAFFKDIENRRIAYNSFSGGSVEVSTVFLGLNHNFGSGPPLLFETMVFGLDDEDHQMRYASVEQAKVGHAEIVELVRRRVENG